MKTILIKISDKYNIPYDIMYIILDICYKNNIKNNINNFIKKNNFNLKETEFNIEGGKYLYILGRLAFNTFRYDEEILKKLVYTKNKLFEEYPRRGYSSNIEECSRSYIEYMDLCYDLIPNCNLDDKLYYVKYII